MLIRLLLGNFVTLLWGERLGRVLGRVLALELELALDLELESGLVLE